MMRGVSAWAVATRGKDGSIAVQAHPVESWVTRSPALRWPVIRGVVALAQSMSIGVKALQISADAQEQEPIPKRTWAFAIVAGLALAVGLFFVIPVLLTSLVKDQLGSAYLFWLVEGGVRTAIFLGVPRGARLSAAPAPPVPVPRRRAQDDRRLRGRRAADGRQRAALQPPAPTLRDQLHARS